MDQELQYDVVILGAGPSGTCAAAILKQHGLSVAIIEKELFPRFSIGESLLPQSMVFLEKAGLLEDVRAAGFQPKDGAVFLRKGEFSVFSFAEKFSAGPHVTYQVQRARFDQVLADGCEKKGVPIFFQHQVEGVDFEADWAKVLVRDLAGQRGRVFRGKFILDASGFGRTLPRLLNLDRPSSFPSRRAVFGHMSTRFPEYFDTRKILITVDDDDSDVWLWTIPFSNQTCSIGVVGTAEYFERFRGKSNAEILQAAIANSPKLEDIMQGSSFINECRTIVGYASNVASLYGDRFALLGNAGEFLDPIFSSGVTIALHSASLAADLVVKHLRGEAVDWEKDFSEKLKSGIGSFKAFVEAWYTGELQSIIFYERPEPRIKKMICSILAGYAWDASNPFAADAKKVLPALAQLCGYSSANPRSVL